jgi:hypothetical protein
LLGGGVCGGWQFRVQPQLRPRMQPPPPTGWTGKAPPGVDGDGGAVDWPDEAADVVITVIAVMSPTAKTSAATQIHHAAAFLVCRFPTIHHSSYSGPDAQNTRSDSRRSPRSSTAKSLAAQPNSRIPTVEQSCSGILRGGCRSGGGRRGRSRLRRIADVAWHLGMRWVAVLRTTAVDADKADIRLGRQGTTGGLGYPRHRRYAAESQDKRDDTCA